MKPHLQEKRDWLKWVNSYGINNFLEAFLKNVENAESECQYCHCKIYVDVLIGGGVPDWSTESGDFGCAESPDTNDEGTGGHMPYKRE